MIVFWLIWFLCLAFSTVLCEEEVNDVSNDGSQTPSTSNRSVSEIKDVIPSIIVTCANLADAADCVKYDFKQVHGGDVLVNSNLKIAPIGWFVSSETELSPPTDDKKWVDIGKWQFFVDTETFQSCFHDGVVDYAVGQNDEFNYFSPYYTGYVTHGESLDVAFNMMMWVKFGVSEPVAMNVAYGCAAKTKKFAKGGVIGRDLLGALKIAVVPTLSLVSFKYQDSKPLVLLNKGTTDAKSDIKIEKDSTKTHVHYYFYRPNTAPLIDIDSLWLSHGNSDLVFDTNLWKHGADYQCYAQQGFTSEYKRALLSLSGGVRIPIVDKNLPANFEGSLDPSEIKTIVQRYIFHDVSCHTPIWDNCGGVILKQSGPSSLMKDVTKQLEQILSTPVDELDEETRKRVVAFKASRVEHEPSEQCETCQKKGEK